MSPPLPKAFISYSHDSAEHDERVRALADRLCGDGVDCTIDQYHPHPPEPWPRWMDRQIEEADFVLVVCTETYLRRAKGLEPPGVGLGVTFESVLIIQDLYDAGMWNEKFFPVLFAGSSAQSIPKPLRGYTHYRADTESGYESLLRHLRSEPKVQKPEVRPGTPLSPIPSPGLSSRYRCMAQPPEEWVHRREYDEVLEALCPKDGIQAGRLVGITTALRGGGGFGKTALAQKLCFDDRVRAAYPDGILWVTMGEDISESGRLSRIRDLIRWWTDQEAPTFETVAAAGAELRKLLAGSRVLVVIDDAWSPSDIDPLKGLESGSALLITTRVVHSLPETSISIPVDVMASSEAVSLLRLGLAGGDSFTKEFGSLTARLGEWALLLKLVNGTLRKLAKGGLSVSEALQRVNEDLDEEGFSAFDQNDPESRHSAASKTILVSVKRLSEKDRDRYLQLAIFPEDEDIPLSVLERYWELSRSATRKLCGQLNDLSLLRDFDQRQKSIRLHDVTRRVLIEQCKEDISSLHLHFLSVSRPASGKWQDLFEEDIYNWKRLGYHLVEAKRGEEFRELLSAFLFLKAKLKATDINDLIVDYEPFVGEDQELRLIRDALRLSAHVLAKDRTQLSSQLFGRLRDKDEERIRALIGEAKSQQRGVGLWPRAESLIQPGGALIRTFDGHTARVNAVAVVDCRRAVSASSDGTVRVWDLESGNNLRTFHGHTGIVSSVAVVDGRRTVSASSDRTVQVWDLESGLTLQILQGHTGWIHAVAVMDDRHAISASSDLTLRVWDLESGQTLQILQGHTARVNAVAVVDDRHAISASSDRTLRLWDLESGQTLQTLKGHTARVNAVAVVDGRHVISASEDGTVRVWNLASGHTIQTLEGHTAGVRAVAIIGGQRAVSTSTDGRLRVWDLESGQILQTLQGHTGKVRAVAVVDGRRAISACSDQTLRLWDLESEHTLHTLEGHTDWVNAVAVVDGRRIVSASYDQTLRVWDLESGQTLQILQGHSAGVNAVAVVDGWHAVSASSDGTVRVWDLERVKILKILQGHMAEVTSVAVVDSRRTVSASFDKTVRVWDLKSGQTLQILQGHMDWVHAVAVVDGRRAVSASEDRTLHVWDLEGGQILQTLEGHTARVYAVAVVDGRRAVSASDDGTLRVWDLDSGKTLQLLEGHTSGVNAVAVVDGRHAVSASSDRTLRVWNLKSGEELTVTTLEAPVLSVAATPDGIIVAGDRLGRVHFFDLVEPE
jgi:WD40 repeat protein